MEKRLQRRARRHGAESAALGDEERRKKIQEEAKFLADIIFSNERRRQNHYIKANLTQISIFNVFRNGRKLNQS